MERESAADGFLVEDGHVVQARRTNGVWSDAERLSHGVQTLSEPVETIPVFGRRIHGEAALHRAQRLTDSARPVVGLEQDKSDSDLGRSLERESVERAVHRARGVVEVVELPDRRDPGVPHLAERADADIAEGSVVERLDERVHRLAPCPEAARPRGKRLAAVAKSALEGVSGRRRSRARARSGEGDRSAPRRALPPPRSAPPHR